MTADLNKAKALLTEGSYTCVLWKEDIFYTSKTRGVKPLLDWLDTGTDLRGFSAADKVVGRAAAFLYCLLGAKEVYASVMSKAALEVLTAQGIAAYYDTLAEGIVNRHKTGPCPMEAATKDLCDPVLALQAVRKTLAAMQQGH